METTLRHWHMLQLIPRYPRKTDAATITRKLGDKGFAISKRTIERDLLNLSTVFPLHCDDRSLPYGWAWSQDGQPFDVPCMDAETALSFTVLDRFSSHLLPGNVTRRIRPHVARAQAVLREMAPRPGARLWPDRVRVLSRSFGLLAPETRPEVADTIYRCLLEQRCFTGLYHSRSGGDGRAREYEVHPLALVFRDEVAYVVATLWDYTDIRQLAMHRFTDAQALDRRRNEPEDFDLDRYIDEGHFHIRESDEDVRLHARFRADAAFHLAETPLSRDQELSTHGSGDVVDVRATVRNTAQLRWWLLGFGDAVEVLRPSPLREELADILWRASAHYVN